MIVQYYADSLGLSRPGIVELKQRYIYLFEKWLKNNYSDDIFLIDRARGGFTIDKLYEIFKEDESYIEGLKDILIIHEGICDCAPRPIPQWLKNFISKLPNFLKIRIIAFLHNNRAKILNRGFVYYQIEQQQYQKLLEDWLKKAVKSFKRIYIFNIAPTNEVTEFHSPGFTKSINLYNKIIQEVIIEINSPQIKLIDINTLIEESGSTIDIFITKEDGHHITSFAHEFYANIIIKLESHYCGINA